MWDVSSPSSPSLYTRLSAPSPLTALTFCPSNGSTDMFGHGRLFGGCADGRIGSWKIQRKQRDRHNSVDDDVADNTLDGVDDTRTPDEGTNVDSNDFLELTPAIFVGQKGDHSSIIALAFAEAPIKELTSVDEAGQIRVWRMEHTTTTNATTDAPPPPPTPLSHGERGLKASFSLYSAPPSQCGVGRPFLSACAVVPRSGDVIGGCIDGSLVQTDRRRTPIESTSQHANAHDHAITSVAVHPDQDGVILTTGDWTCRVWSTCVVGSTPVVESILSSSCFSSPLRCSCWSDRYPWLFFVGDAAGAIHGFDLLRDRQKSVMHMQVSAARDRRMIDMRAAGDLIAILHDDGSITLVEIDKDFIRIDEKNDNSNTNQSTSIIVERMFQQMRSNTRHARSKQEEGETNIERKVYRFEITDKNTKVH